MTAPATPNNNANTIARFYDGLRLGVLGKAAGVDLTASGHGTAFTVPRAQQALLVMVVIDNFTVAKIDSGITLSYGYTPTAYGDFFSAAFGVVIGKGVGDVVINAGGSGYSSATVLFVSNDLGRGATGHVVLTGDAVSAVIIDNPGYGYVVEPTVDITGDGTGADAAALLGTTTVYPRPIIALQPVALARIAGGITVQWAITNALAGMGTCDITWLGQLL
jgi:hypothetical protein